MPLTDSFDSRFYGTAQALVTPVEITGRIEEAGVDDLRIVAPNRSIDYHQDAHFDGIKMDNIVDSWLRGLTFEDATNSVFIGYKAELLTVERVDVYQHDTQTWSRPLPPSFQQFTSHPPNGCIPNRATESVCSFPRIVSKPSMLSSPSQDSLSDREIDERASRRQSGGLLRSSGSWLNVTMPSDKPCEYTFCLTISGLSI